MLKLIKNNTNQLLYAYFRGVIQSNDVEINF